MNSDTVKCFKEGCHDDDANLSIFASLYTGKKVLLLGPADCVADELFDMASHNYDTVVKLNHHWNKYTADRIPRIASDEKLF